MPAGKIGLYTRFFDYANFRLPLSTFLIDVLRNFRINISQLSVIGAAKVFHFEILCHVYGVIPTVGLFRCFYVNSKKNGWMSFSKCSDNAPVEASVDRLFDEGRSGDQTEQGGSAGSGRGADIQLVSTAVDTVVEDVAPVQPTHQRKRKTIVVGAGEASHPPKNLREDHGTSSRPSVAGKSRYALQMLLAGAVLNPEVGVTTMPTLPFVIASVSTTPEREDGDHADSLAGLNLRTIGAPQRYVISSDPSHHSHDDDSGGADPNTCIFSDLSCSDFLVGGIRTFNVGVARQMSLSVEVRMRAGYNVKERRRLKSVVEKKDELLKARDEEIENLKAHILLKEAEAAEAIRLRAEASNFETVEKSFRDEVNALKERSTILKKSKPRD
ncbi:hypothetical protein Tco_1241650 [Tanacetum coccineum]